MDSRIERIVAKLKIDGKKRGGRLWALCPFHEDHTPTNWMIRIVGPRAGQWHCFSCKNGGGLVDLVMHIRKYDMRDSARDWLANFEEAPPPPASGVRFVVDSPTRRGFRMPREVILDEPLADWVTPAQVYARSRGITDEQAREWRLGYAVDGRLQGRIVFPTWTIAEGVGRAHGYHARTFVNSERRYLYPHEREKADLGVMFGEMHWPSIVERRRCTIFVVEGAINGLAIQRVIPETRYAIGAIGGSNVVGLHVAKIATFGQVVLVTDNDLAGNQAATIILGGLARHARARRVTLPKKQDCQSLPPDDLRLRLFDPLHSTA